MLLGLRGKYSASDARFVDENAKLTEEYKRITEHFKDMQVRGGGGWFGDGCKSVAVAGQGCFQP